MLAAQISEFAPYLTRESGNRRFPAGARDRGNCRRLPRKDFRRSKSKQTSRIGGANVRHGIRQRVRALLGGNGDGTVARGLLYEMRAVGLVACDRDEQEARLYLAAVGGDTGDLDSVKP